MTILRDVVCFRLLRIVSRCTDINNDKRMDIVVSNEVDNSVSVLLGDGSGNFTEPLNNPFSVGKYPCSLFVIDVNSDNKKDIITANWGSNNVSILFGDGTGEFTEEKSSSF